MVKRFCIGLNTAYYFIERTVFKHWYIYDGDDKHYIFGLMNPKTKKRQHISEVKSIKDFNGCLVMIAEHNIPAEEILSTDKFSMLSTTPVTMTIRFQ